MHLHARGRLRRTLSSCHHNQRLGYGRVSLGVVVGRRYWWSNGVCMVVDLTWLIQRRLLAWETRPVGSLVAHRARLCGYLRASKGKRRLQLKWLGDICGEGLAKVVDLLVHLRHGPRGSACLQDAHVAHKEFPRIVVELWVRASDGNLCRC